MKSFGAAMYAVGFLVAGIMFIMVGLHYDETIPEFHKIHYDIWVYAWALIAAAVGIILETERVFCGDDTHKRVGYFAGLFELVGIFSMGAFGFGLAVYFSAAKNDDDAARLLSANDRRDLSSMIAVSSIVYLLSAVLVVLESYRKGRGFFDVNALLSYFNMSMCLILTIFWFLFAQVMVSSKDSANKRSKEYAYVIGIILLFTGAAGFLKCIGAVRD